MRISDWSSDVCSSDLLAPLEFPGDIDCLSVQIIDEHDLLVFEPIEPATEFIRASGQVVVALAIHAMSFGLQYIFLLDRQFIVLIHLPNCRTGAEQRKGSRCGNMLLHLCLDRKSTRLHSSHSCEPRMPS